MFLPPINFFYQEIDWFTAVVLAEARAGTKDPVYTAALVEWSMQELARNKHPRAI